VGSLALTINGERREVPPGTRLLDLLAILGLDARAVAVERNGELVARARFGEVELRAGDRLELVRFVQGGRSSAGGGIVRRSFSVYT
jgi:thiamine biosynthesis protein ThiS